MNLGKLQKQLLRDLKKSPMKAGALGLLSLVAVYFWAPLVLGYFSKEKPPAGAATQAAAVATATPETVPGAATPAMPPVGLGQPWKQVAQSIEKDQRMASADGRLAFRLPFGDPTAVEPDAEEEQQREKEQQATANASLDPAKLGLNLSATMLGNRRRVAMINGKPYAEGSQIRTEAGLVLRVAQIAERHVVLESNNRRLELAIADAAATASRPKLEIEPARPAVER